MCNPLIPATCGLDAAVWGVNKVGEKAGEGILEQVATYLRDASLASVKGALGWWMDPALSPKVATNGATSSVISDLQSGISTLVVFAAVLGLLVACAQVALTQRGQPLMRAGFMLMTTSAVTGLAAVTVQLLLTFTDSLSADILATAGKGVNDPSSTLFKTGEGAAWFGIWVTMGPAITFTGLAQAALMIFRAAVIPALLAVLPLAAAMSTVQPMWLKRIGSWLLAFVLYKPIAALVYALGINLMTDFKTGTDLSTVMMGFATGLTVLWLAILCLPALVKLVSPVAGVGNSSMFSGAAMGAAVAMGAALPAMAGSVGAAPAAVPTSTPPTNVPPSPTISPDGGTSNPPPASPATNPREALETASHVGNMISTVHRGTEEITDGH